VVEEAEVIFHEGNQPDAFVDLADSDLLPSEDGAEVNLLSDEADSPAGCDGDGLVVEWVVERLKAAVGAD
jgi:hypothetical protein